METKLMIEEALLAGMRQMWPLFALMIVAMIVPAVLPRRPRRQFRMPTTFPYARQPALFTRTELEFLRALRKAAPHLYIPGKVRLEDVIGVRSGLPRSEYEAARNRIKSRHLDFVLVDVETTQVVCAFELDDPSHNRSSARQSDEFKDRALKAAGIPLLRVRAAASYRVDQLARTILDSTRLPDLQIWMPVSQPGPYEMNDLG